MYMNLTTNLMVNNVEESIKFYEDVLGFSVEVSVPDDAGGLQFAILKKDSISLMLQEKENLIEEYPVLKTTAIKPSITLYIIVDNFDLLYADIKTKHEIYTDIHVTPYGKKEFAILDKDGYVLTITQG